MAEYSANAVQIVQPGESVIFTASASPCQRGFVRHRDDTGNFLLVGWLPPVFGCRCPCCRRQRSAEFLVDFRANIATLEGATPGPLSVAIAVDGATIPVSSMIATPAAAGDFQNVSGATTVDIFEGCCQTVTVRNTSDQAIQVQNANILFSRPDLAVTR